MTLSSLSRSSAALGLLVLPAVALAQANDFEAPPVFRAADVVDRAELLSGEQHELGEEVTTDGFFYRYVIHSEFGDFEVLGEALLESRVQEVYAIARLREMSRGEAFAGTMKDAALAPVETVGKVVTDPVGTAKGLPSGISRRFRGLYYKAKKTAHQVGDAVAGPDETEDGQEESSRDVARQTADVAKDVAGYNSARRDLAQRLGIDPYSSNPVLGKELDRLTQAAFAAGLSFKMVAPSSSVVDVASDVSELVWEMSPDELERRNDKALKKLGVDAPLRREFFEHPSFTTTYETLFVEAFRELEGVASPEVVIETALLAGSELEAVAAGRALRVMARVHENEQKLKEFVIGEHPELGRLLAARTADGTVIVPGAVDVLSWQSELAVPGSLAAFEKRALWLTGVATERARRELEARRWRVVERALAPLD